MPKDFVAVAKCQGDSIQFNVTADSIKMALLEAKDEAKRVFDSPSYNEIPKVAVKPAKEEKEEV